MTLQLFLPFFLCRQIHLARVSLPHHGGKKPRSLRGFLTRQMSYLELQILGSSSRKKTARSRNLAASIR
jgi:hypothetical protein